MANFLHCKLALKLHGRAELERLEGRVQTLYSVRVTAGRGGRGVLQGERGKDIASNPMTFDHSMGHSLIPYPATQVHKKVSFKPDCPLNRKSKDVLKQEDIGTD